MIGDNSVKIIFQDKEVRNADVLFTFSSKEFNKNYIVFTDNTIDSDGNLNIISGSYDRLEETTVIRPIQDEDELNLVKEAVDDFINCLREVENNS